jgi:hypothetical protein
MSEQKDWRFCRKCGASYFDGRPEKGVCAAGGGHEAAGFNFVLAHDIPESSTEQKDWRFCVKCVALRQFKSEVQQELMAEDKVLRKGFDSQGIFWVCD